VRAAATSKLGRTPFSNCSAVEEIIEIVPRFFPPARRIGQRLHGGSLQPVVQTVDWIDRVDARRKRLATGPRRRFPHPLQPAAIRGTDIRVAAPLRVLAKGSGDTFVGLNRRR
jgi:hypothetical protein